MRKSGRLINNLEPGKRTVDVPFALKHTQVAVDTSVAWCRQSEQQHWQEMLEDLELKKKLGDGWGSKLSRVPNEWHARLDMKPLGQPPLLRRRPELLAQTDSLREEERSLLEPVSMDGFFGGFPHPPSTGWRVGGSEASEGWRVGRFEGWKVGGLEGWRVGGLEGWKVGRLELEGWRWSWKVGRLEG